MSLDPSDSAHPIELTDDQRAALGEFDEFIRAGVPRSAFLLTGSAGTGKTFLINILSRELKRKGYDVVLLAPTGRAAKVITRRTKRLAFTIHHHIYSPLEAGGGEVYFRLKENKAASRTVYIVDEASMIGDDGGVGVLRDLCSFVYGNEPDRKMILVGDPVQLPPVGLQESPALDPLVLRREVDAVVWHAHLTEVKRQLHDSEVLDNAVRIRDAYLSGDAASLVIEPGREVQVLENGYEGIEIFLSYYREGDPDRAIFITYSNWQATKVNQAIRQSLHGSQELILPSDQLMVVRNNYRWGDPKRLPFLANGEMGIVREVYLESMEELYSLQWVDAEVEFQDNHGEPFLVSCKLILSLLNAKEAQVDNATMNMITRARQEEYKDLPFSKAQVMMQQDPYIHALQVKYGYAITGHKSQGGQWDNVVIGFEPDYGNDPMNYLRWSYTVFTRAESHVFLLSCPFDGAKAW
ncbi:MAG: AAA family ATPase [Bacteroidia bacterium]|nr:AAA family ATPase [Bacteroidia bacterium]